MDDNLIRRGLKNASFLLVSNLFARVIQFFLMIYVARVLGPEDYGKWAFVVTFVGLFAFITIRGLNKSLIREGSKSPESFKENLESIIGLRHIFTSLSIIICIFASFFTPYDNAVKFLILIFSFDLLIGSYRNVYNSILKAYEKFNIIASINILEKIFYSILIFSLLSYGYGLEGMVFSSLISSFFILLVIIFFSRKQIKFDIWKRPNLGSELIRPSINFSILSFVRKLSFNIDLFFISLVGTFSEVGIYAVCTRLLSIFNTLRNVNAETFLPIVVKNNDSKYLTSKFLYLSSFYLMLTMLILAFPIYFFRETIVNQIFGEDFSSSADILGILVFYQVFFWGTLPQTTVMQSNYNENVLTGIYTICALANLTMNYFFYYSFGLIGIAYSTVIVYFTFFVLTSYLGKKSVRS